MLFFLLLSLRGIHLIEWVDSVKNSVAKFSFLNIFCKNFFKSLEKHRVFKNLVNAWPISWVLHQEGADQIVDILVKTALKWWIFTFDDLLRQLSQIASGKWRVECTHFVEQDSEGPNIGLVIIFLGLDQFWRKVVRSTNHTFSLRFSVVENLSNTEVTHFHLAIFRHKHVLRFDVSVQYLPVVNMLDGQTYLCKPIEDLILTPVLGLPACILGLFDRCLHMGLQVSVVSVLHDDAKLPFLGSVNLMELDDVRVIKNFQNLCLLERFFPLFITHILDVNLLDYGLSTSVFAIN